MSQDAVRAAFEAAGIGVLYLPRYSPEYNPIELCWAVVKAQLGPRSRRAVTEQVRTALRIDSSG